MSGFGLLPVLPAKPALDVFARVATVKAISLPEFSFEPHTAAVDRRKNVVRLVAPLLLDGAFDLLSIFLDTIPVHIHLLAATKSAISKPCRSAWHPQLRPSNAA